MTPKENLLGKFNENLPEDILEPSWVDSYKQEVDLLYRQLLRLNTNTFLLQKILTFPFHLLELPCFPFWWYTAMALTESNILLIWKLSVDNANEQGLTLQQFQKHIRQNLIDNQQIRERFTESLKPSKYSKMISIFDNRIRDLRCHSIAHLDIQAHINPTQEQIQETTVLVSELKEYQDVLNAFFESLRFGPQRPLLLPLEYNYEIQISGFEKTDIEQLLDGTAMHSSILNLPETNSLHWALRKKTLSGEELETLNRHRARLNLPPA